MNCVTLNLYVGGVLVFEQTITCDVLESALQTLKKYNDVEVKSDDPQAVWICLCLEDEVLCEYSIDSNDELVVKACP